MTAPEQTAIDRPAPTYPMRRADPRHPAPELARLRDDGEAATRVTLWDGSEAWLVTAHEHVRALLGDRRLTAVTSAPGFPMLTPTSKLVRAEPKSASFIRMDDPDHSRLRSMLTREFLQREADVLRPLIREHLDATFAELTAGPQPADLVRAVTLPLPSRVIALLLGIPAEHQEEFERHSAVLIDRGHTRDEVVAARDALDSYLRSHVERRLGEPADDLVGRLVANHVAPGSLTIDEAVPMCRLVLVAGHGTTASQAALSLLSVVTDERLAATLRTSPDTLPGVVEELLRFHSIIQYGLARAATEDVRVGGVTIRAGEGIVLSLAAANRDPRRFDDPDVVDPRRDARRHLAFGHGMHQCLGQWLARVELAEMIAALLRWMPDARLAVDEAELEFRHDVSSYGLATLPVTW